MKVAQKMNAYLWLNGRSKNDEQKNKVSEKYNLRLPAASLQLVLPHLGFFRGTFVGDVAFFEISVRRLQSLLENTGCANELIYIRQPTAGLYLRRPAH